MTEKEQHLDIREKLQRLPSVKASDDFIIQLQRRINLTEAQPSTQIHKQHQEKLESGFFARLFGQSKNAWMVPAIGVTAVVFLVFIWVFVINQNNITTSGDINEQTMSKSEEPANENKSLTSGDEGNTNTGETLKTKLPGTEIATNFGYTDSRSELDRRDLEGGITDEEVSEKPEVKISQPLKTEDDVTTETPAPSMEVRGMKKKEEEEKSSMKTGVLKEKESSTPPGDKRTTDSLGNTSDDKVKSSDEGKRVTRNLIDKTDLENLQEKVQEKSIK